MLFKVDVPALIIPANVVPLEERKPHLMLPTFWERAQAGTCTSLAADLLAFIRSVEKEVESMSCSLTPSKSDSYHNTRNDYTPSFNYYIHIQIFSN